MRRKLFWLFIGSLVATLVLVSCSGSSSEQNSTTGQPIPTEEQPEEVSSDPDTLTSLKIGETFNSTNVVVKVSEASIVDRYEFLDAILKTKTVKEAEPGKVFVFASVEIENISNRVRLEEGSERFRLADSTGNSYLASTYLGDDHLVTHIRFEVGGKMSGKIMFQIPSGAAGLQIEYWRKTFPEVKIAEWKLD